jgi:hypothetical protein
MERESSEVLRALISILPAGPQPFPRKSYHALLLDQVPSLGYTERALHAMGMTCLSHIWGQLFEVPQIGFPKNVTWRQLSNRLFCWSRYPKGGSNMATAYEGELELEFEEELEGLGEHPETALEFEHPELAHEFEHPELAHEFENLETAHEFEHPELAHEFEHPELAHEFEHPELAHEFEGGEQFFGRIARGIGSFVRRAAPMLRNIARIAAPMVGTAIGGPFGAILGRVASSALGEGELEFEGEHPESTHEFEAELEAEMQHEASHEVAHEIAQHEMTQHEALAEMLAEAASHEQHEAQAEAMAGAAVVTVLSPRDRRALRRLLPHLVRGAAVLTRILRRRRATRPAVRAVPTIMRRTVRQLKRQAAAGQPVTRRAAAKAAAVQTRRVLSNPNACAAAIRQNVRASSRLRTAGIRG